MVNAPVVSLAEDSFDWEEEDEEIRAKWMLDGCCTLAEVIEALRSKIREVEEARRKGWELTGRIEDDYGFMRVCLLSHNNLVAHHASMAFSDCAPNCIETRDQWENVLHIAGGQLKHWGTQSALSWQTLCQLAFGKSFPTGNLSSMTSSADTILTAIKTLQNEALLPCETAESMFDDIVTLKKAVALCMAHGCSLMVVKQ